VKQGFVKTRQIFQQKQVASPKSSEKYKVMSSHQLIQSIYRKGHEKSITLPQIGGKQLNEGVTNDCEADEVDQNEEVIVEKD